MRFIVGSASSSSPALVNWIAPPRACPRSIGQVHPHWTALAQPCDVGLDVSVIEEPPHGEGEPGPHQAGGLGQFDAQRLADLFESAGDAAVV